ncbi:uncharacterized protein LOC121603936 isoform X2 [Chelmon rostratus]|uniref:uncharacterized protein LOC121603936 isoform X2 n=1 Tax=Chelmon rostratus TaxID=109905 RepID=UPI001BE625AF|nr:uncharacterized protein LOC121603936 isoform X2 [Chelmon rostratus]
MNMASIGILIVTVISLSVGNARTFVNVECKTETLAQHGQPALLECVIKTRQDVTDVQMRVVTWKKRGVDEPLLVYNRGRITHKQGYSLAEPSWNYKNMNVTLLIANTAIEDSGVYECMVMTNSGENTNHTYLKVTAKYSVPTIKPKPDVTDKPETGEQGQVKGLDPASKVVAPVVVIGSLIVGLLLVLFYKRRRRSDRQGVRTCESDVEEGDHQEMDEKCQDDLA